MAYAAAHQGLKNQDETFDAPSQDEAEDDDDDDDPDDDDLEGQQDEDFAMDRNRNGQIDGHFSMPTANDHLYSLTQIIAFYRQEGTTSLKAELCSTYKIYQSNYQGMQYVRRITDWVKENRIPTPAGKEMLRELQIFSGRLQGKDVKALEAKLLKAEFGNTPFLADMASVPSVRGSGGGFASRRGGSFRGRGGFQSGRGGGGGGGAGRCQCASSDTPAFFATQKTEWEEAVLPAHARPPTPTSSSWRDTNYAREQQTWRGGTTHSTQHIDHDSIRSESAAHR